MFSIWRVCRTCWSLRWPSSTQKKKIQFFQTETVQWNPALDPLTALGKHYCPCPSHLDWATIASWKHCVLIVLLSCFLSNRMMQFNLFLWEMLSIFALFHTRLLCFFLSADTLHDTPLCGLCTYPPSTSQSLAELNPQILTHYSVAFIFMFSVQIIPWSRNHINSTRLNWFSSSLVWWHFKNSCPKRIIFVSRTAIKLLFGLI